MKINQYILLAILLSSTSLGCSYFEKRAYDFGDCFYFSASIGPCVETSAQIGPIRVALGAGQKNSFVFEKCKSYLKKELVFGVPFPQIGGVFCTLVYALLRTDLSKEYPTFLLLYITSSIQESHINNKASNIDYIVFNYNILKGEKYNVIDLFSLRFSFTVVVGIEIGFNIAEFADFILGFFGLDIIGDDEREKPAIVRSNK